MSRLRPARGRRGTLAAVLATVAAAALAAGAPAAHAACMSSTPAAVAHADPIDGESGLAPEITTVRAAVDGACTVVVDPGIPTPLVGGDAVFVYLDVDGDAATGSPLPEGADVAIGTLGGPAGQSPPRRGVWNGTTFRFTDPGPVGANVGNGGFAANVTALAVAPGALVRLIVVSLRSGAHDAYLDLAPDTGRIVLPVHYAATEPWAAPPAKPTKRTSASQARCALPRTKGLTAARARSRLRAAGCTVAPAARRAYSATVRRGRVIRTSVAASGRVTLVVSRGKRPRRARAADAGTALERLNALVAQVR